MTFSYCPSCGSRIGRQSVEGRFRLACDSPGCGYVHWNNPIPVVAALVRLDDDYILARNAAWPDGLFSVLTGFLEEGEAPEIAVTREVGEELGLDVQAVRFIGHFPFRERNQLIIAFTCLGKGSVVPGDEIAEIRIVPDHELASYDFGPLRLTQEIVGRWLGRGGKD